MAEAESTVMYKLHKDPSSSWDWEAIKYYSHAEGAEGSPEARVEGPWYEKRIVFVRKVDNGDLVMLHGTNKSEPDKEFSHLYQIYEIEDEKLTLLTNDSTEGLRTILGGLNPGQNGGRWRFGAKHGALAAAAPARSMNDVNYGVTGYLLGPDCPYYLEAIKKNWGWQDHFRAVLADIDLEHTKKLSRCDDPALASEVVWLLGQMIQLREQQAKDAARLETALEAIKEVGQIALKLHLPALRNPMQELLQQKGSRFASVQVGDQIYQVLELCCKAHPEVQRLRANEGKLLLPSPYR